MSGPRIFQLRFGHIDTDKFFRRAAIQDDFTKGARTTTYIEPTQSLFDGKPIHVIMADDATPFPVAFFVCFAIRIDRRKIRQWVAPPSAP